MFSPDDCPNISNHTVDPDKMAMRPTRCPGCYRFLVWVPFGERPPSMIMLPVFDPPPVPPVPPSAKPPVVTPPVVAIDPEVMTAEQMKQALDGEVVFVPVEGDQMT